MIWLNDVLIEFDKFPNGETKMNESEIRNNAMSGVSDLKFKYSDDSDLIKLMFVKKYLDSIDPQAVTTLTILYMPYSRMDRVEDNSAFTLKYVSEFINLLNFNYISMIEPHSDVSTALLNNCSSSFPSVNILYDVKVKIGFNMDMDYIYYPDVSAEKRYGGKIGNGYKSLIGMKKRDFKTGNILKLDVIGDIKKTGFKVIMIDDLSSRGTTFIKGAEKLREMGASEIYLVVGHCEDTIYEGEILKNDLIDRVYTTSSIITNYTSDKIKIYEL